MKEPPVRKRELIPSERITDGSGHFFYGYYDNPAISGNDRYHLVHRVPFCDRMQEAGDTAEIGMIDMSVGAGEPGAYIPLAKTTAWNFQQGSMLQWNPLAPDDEILYNVTRDGEYRTAVLNVHTKSTRYLDRPVATVDPLGKIGLSINFGRMFDFRPGYGYADIPDPFREELHPAEDGVFRVDLRTGASTQILSLKEIWAFIQPIFQWEEAKLVINHITLNPDGSRFVFLARSIQPGKRWVTALLTANTDGSGLRCLSPSTLQSHYHWRDPQHFVIYGGGPKGNHLYLYQDEEVEGQVPEPVVLDGRYFLRDGHCSYSPDRNWMLYDSYPDQNRLRHLYVYDLREKRGITLGSYYSPPEIDGDIRCDLHPRWNRAGTAITFDSVHEGQRHVYRMDLRSVLKR